MLMEVQPDSISIEALCISTSNELSAKRLHNSLTNTGILHPQISKFTTAEGNL